MSTKEDVSKKIEVKKPNNIAGGGIRLLSVAPVEIEELLKELEKEIEA